MDHLSQFDLLFIGRENGTCYKDGMAETKTVKRR